MNDMMTKIIDNQFDVLTKAAHILLNIVDSISDRCSTAPDSPLKRDVYDIIQKGLRDVKNQLMK